MYKRKVLSGEFIIINKYLINDLTKMNLWNSNIIDYLKISGGSIQNIDGLSNEFKSLYKTAWEVSQKSIMKLAIDRQPFIDQSQSMNLFFSDFNFNKFNQAQFYAWDNKLKTGSYYIRTKAAVSAQKFTVNPNIENKLTINSNNINLVNENLDTYDENVICTLCSS
jgi:ribonucleotide reductase alpha subunit